VTTAIPEGKTNCTPSHCAYGHGHACQLVTAYPEAFPPEGGWTYAWRGERARGKR
jgi:hypothetical protein